MAPIPVFGAVLVPALRARVCSGYKLARGRLFEGGVPVLWGARRRPNAAGGRPPEPLSPAADRLTAPRPSCPPAPSHVCFPFSPFTEVFSPPRLAEDPFYMTLLRPLA